MRKMLVAMAKDLRVLIIKLADRLHNMRTLAALPEWKQERIARETLDIYAPLAHRLGMQEVKQQLEDLAFAALHPKRYAEIDQMVAQPGARARALPDPGARGGAERLQELRIDADVTGRPKHLWSIYEKMVVKGQRVRRHLRPGGHPGRRRLGEGLLRGAGLDPRHVEAGAGPVQGLHRHAQVQPLPVAAHHGGRAAGQAARGADPHPRDAPAAPSTASPPTGPTRTARPTATTRSGSTASSTGSRRRSDPAEFMANLKVDLDQDEVFVFTPKGGSSPCPAAPRRSTSPTPSTPRSGTRASAPGSTAGWSPLDYRLSSGDTVEIFTSKVEGAGPSPDWLEFVGTPRAGIEDPPVVHRASAARTPSRPGATSCIKALRREGLPVQKLAQQPTLDEVATSLNYADLDALYAAIGEHHVSAKPRSPAKVARVLRRRRSRAEEQLPATVHGRRPHRRLRADTPACTSRGSTT